MVEFGRSLMLDPDVLATTTGGSTPTVAAGAISTCTGGTASTGR